MNPTYEIVKPTKEAVRAAAIENRGKPPMSPEEYRRKVGWYLKNPVKKV